MSFNPRASVQEGLDLLSRRLDPIIADRLAEHLQGLPWTAILKELDLSRGYRAMEYKTSDIQAQLRMITERLGKLGYPFDDNGDLGHSRVISTLGSELRIVRNYWAHGHKFTALDAWRAQDFIVRLLQHLGDREGRNSAKILRQAALIEVANEMGIGANLGEEDYAEQLRVPPIKMPEPEPTSCSDEPEQVSPDASVLVRHNKKETPRIGTLRAEFQPWTVVPVGESAVLENLRQRDHKNLVRAVAIEITKFEGPIHVNRLAALVAESFGFSRLYDKRKKQIVGQIKSAGLTVDRDRFVWPENLLPGEWQEFRPNSSEVKREFTEISPAEIRNAANFIHSNQPEISRSELERLTLQTFGRKRRTQKVLRHLKKALGTM